MATDQEVTFTGVHVFRSGHVVVPSVIDEYAAENRDHALVFHRRDGKWGHQHIANAIAGVCVVDGTPPKVLHLGVDGEIPVSTLPGKSVERIDQGPDGPNRSAFLRCIQIVGDSVYAAGMARQVYRRSPDGTWARADAGIFVPREQRKESVGLTSIDGHSESALYAVGYHGEIWFFDGGEWRMLDSPTKVTLTVVKCAADGLAYVGGLAGTLLRRTRTGWTVLSPPEPKGDIWGIAELHGRIYVATHDGVFVLDNGDRLVRVDMGLDVRPSTGYLDSNDGVLYSVGHKDVAWTADGSNWTLLDKP